jgi:hypothetical protein
MRKDPQAFMRASMGGVSGVNIRMGSTTTSNIRVSSGLVINNPIELPEKK